MLAIVDILFLKNSVGDDFFSQIYNIVINCDEILFQIDDR